MKKEEFKKWKEENKQEYDVVLIQVMERVFRDLLSHSLDDTLWEDEQQVTYRDAVIALSSQDKEWIKDELVMMLKNLNDYIKKKGN